MDGPTYLEGGYDKLSYLMGEFPSLTAFRKFGALTAKSLLNMQAELVHLEYDLAISSREDRKDHATADLAVSLKALEASSDAGAADSQKKEAQKIQEKLQKVQMIQEKLQQYHSRLLQVSAINALSKPVNADISFLREWLDSPEGGNLFLQGIESETWEEKHTPDLVVLSEQHSRDDFAQYLSDKIVPWYHRRIGQRRKADLKKRGWGGIWEYKDKDFVLAASLICTFLSAVTPTLSIFLLYFVQDMVARLAVITATAFLFAFLMTFVIRARRVDVFAATTAFAAVQVVFVGGTNNVSMS